MYSDAVGNVVTAGRPWAWGIVAIGLLLLGRSVVPAGQIGLDALVRVGATTALALSVIAFGAAALSGQRIPDSLRTRRAQPPIGLIESATLIVGLLALSSLMDLAIEHFDLRAASRLGVIEDALADLHGSDVWLALGAVALAPAIAEELLFRGYLLGALLSRLRPARAVVLSAVCFGLAHFDLVQGSAAAILGLYLGAVSIATGSIRICVAAHFFNNALAVLDPSLAESLGSHPIVGTGVSAVLAAGGLGSWIVLRRRLEGATLRPG